MLLESESAYFPKQMFRNVWDEFSWDENNTEADPELCPWVRVKKSAASENAGYHFMPRVGDEVTVSYVNSNPNEPPGAPVGAFLSRSHSNLVVGARFPSPRSHFSEPQISFSRKCMEYQ